MSPASPSQEAQSCQAVLFRRANSLEIDILELLTVRKLKSKVQIINRFLTLQRRPLGPIETFLLYGVAELALYSLLSLPGHAPHLL